MSTHCFSAIVLAAGYSSRMGDFKPLLPLGSETVVNRVVSMFQKADIEDIVVVVGHRGQELSSLLNPRGIRTVPNPDFDQGMFTSIQTGVRHLDRSSEAFFLLPVDIPLVRTSTLNLLMDFFHRDQAPVIHPCFKGRRGHPPLIHRNLYPEIQEAGPEATLRTILGRYMAQMKHVEVPDRNILFDADTPEAFQELLARWDSRHIPTEEECEVLFDLLSPGADEVRKHCQAVARAALKIGKALNDQGLELDLDLIRAAALVHDIAKPLKEHAIEGGARIKALGFDRVAEIVARHTDFESLVDEAVTEDEVVYLSDKLFKDDQAISLEQRYQAAKAKFGHSTQALKRIEGRWLRAQKSQKRLEHLLGKPLEQVIGPDSV